MYHELLLAMSGLPGDIFVDAGEDVGIVVSEEIPFLTASERAIMGELCSLGYAMRTLEKFARTCEGISRAKVNALVHGQYASAAAMKDEHGLYLRALAGGLERVLQPYRDLIVDAERDVLAEPSLPVTHLRHKFREYKLLFPALVALASTITSRKVRGCALLELLHQRSICGTPCVQAAMTELLRVCHGVLYRQLSAWMVYGVLLDANDEFFIRRQTPLSAATEATKEAPRDESSTWLGTYSLKVEMLPSYIPLRVAAKILFVGKAIQLVSPSSPARARDASALASTKASVTAEEERSFLDLFAGLKRRAEFDAAAFENAIDTIRDVIARHLWQLMVAESDLMGHIRAVKDFFLLGKGEAFLAFFDLARKLMAMPPTSTFETDLNSLFQTAIASVSTGHADEDVARTFRLVYEKDDEGDAKQPKQGARTSVDLWPRIGMECNVRWPLDLFFTPDLVKKYNMLFRFLLVAKRTQTRLQALWVYQMRGEGRGSHAEGGRLPEESAIESTLAAAWRLRNNMSFLVDNMQYYLQIDVLEVQHANLESAIEKTKDFESMVKSHEAYVAALLSQCFLLSKPVSRLLHEVFDLCHSFCDAYSSAAAHLADLAQYREHQRLADKRKGKTGAQSAPSQQQQPVAEMPTPSPALPQPLDRSSLASMQKTFDRQIGFLLRMLSGVRGAQYSPHLAQLLLRLDFNGYYAGLLSTAPAHAGTATEQAHAQPTGPSYGGVSATQQHMLASLEPSRIDK